MTEWKQIKLRDTGTIITGNTPPTAERDYYGNEYMFIKPTDITEGVRHVENTEEKFSNHGFERYKKSLLPINTPCVVTIGSLGKKLCLTKEPSFTNQAINAIKMNKGNDGRFIYYTMKIILPMVKHLSSGTASGRENVSKSSFGNIKINIPPLPTQQKIAEILSAYDDLIENNNRRIELLEQAAQQLYKEWFVRFRFPGYETANFTKGLPEGWEMVNLGSLIKINSKNIDKKYKYNNINYIDISSVEEGKVLEKTQYNIDQAPGRAKRMIADGDVLWSMVRPNLRAYALILDPEPNDIASTGFAVLTPTKVPFSFLYNTVTADGFVDYLSNYARGSAYPAVTSTEFEKAKVLLPTSKLLTEYYLRTEPLYREIRVLQHQTQNLTKQRDLLLPRLMSRKLGI